MRETIRFDVATVGDAARLAELAGQLGYAVTESVVACALRAAEGNRTETVLVARDGTGRVVAWAGISVVRHFYTPVVAELSGFVVDASMRGRGIGTRLMAEAVRWARESGCPALRLRANETRAGAHAFYDRLGFRRTKRQIVFVLPLDEALAGGLPAPDLPAVDAAVGPGGGSAGGGGR